MTSGTHYYYHPDTRPKNLSPARRLFDLLLLPPQVAPREKKKITLQIFRLFRYSYPSSSLRCSLVASARLCCLSRVPPAVCPSLLESATTVCTSFLQSLSTYVHTPTPHSILRFRPAPQTPDLHTSNLPLFASTADTQPCEGPPSRLYHF